jgi:hypothetical protein
MKPHSFSLSSIGMAKGRAQVKLDGEDISDAVSGVGLDFSAREHPRVMLELSGVSADVAVGEAEIQLPAGVVAMLQRLGWTPPVPNSDETSGEVSPDAVGRVIT